MSKRSFNPYECIGPLNNIKKAMQLTGRPFNKETILNSLKSCGLPTNKTFWGAFRKSGILQEASKGQFMFTSKNPIFVGELIKIQEKYQELSRRYKNNSVQKQDTPKPEEKEETQNELPENDPLALTQFAIDLLKEQGYLIFAPTCIEYTQMQSYNLQLSVIRWFM